MVSTIFVVVATLFGPLPLMWYSNYVTLKWDLSKSFNISDEQMTGGITRSITLAVFQLGQAHRNCGIFIFQLLVFAPRFLPFVIACATLFVAQVVEEGLEMSLLLRYMTDDDENVAWAKYLNHYSFNMYGEPFFVNLVTYAVPAALVWIFERMLHSSLQRNVFALCFI